MFRSCIGFLIGLAVALALGVLAPAQSDPRPGHVGDAKCLSCHPKQKEFPRTAHHLTSRAATRESIAGSFTPPKNVLKTPEPELQYRMEAHGDEFFQTGVLGIPPHTVSMSQRMDLVVGSGRKGQTYLYWGGGVDGGPVDRLFQLPVSYWTEIASWVNSPGYGDRVVDFSRPVLPRCLECHASYFEPIADPAAPNRYRKAGYALGVTCERCHGPGEKHSAANAVAGVKPVDQAITNPAKLPRDRQLDLCSLCHGGIGIAKTAVFSYTVGNSLKDHLQLEHPDLTNRWTFTAIRSRCWSGASVFNPRG